MQKADFCPMNIEPFISCLAPAPSWLVKSKAFVKEENFGKESRCFNTDFGRPLCLKSFCDPKLGAIWVKFGEASFKCEYDGQMINVDIGGKSVDIECPKKAVFCPEMICPLDCGGTGVCNWDLPVPQCEPIQVIAIPEPNINFNVTEVFLDNKTIPFPPFPVSNSSQSKGPHELFPIVGTINATNLGDWIKEGVNFWFKELFNQTVWNEKHESFNGTIGHESNWTTPTTNETSFGDFMGDFITDEVEVWIKNLLSASTKWIQEPEWFDKTNYTNSTEWIQHIQSYPTINGTDLHEMIIHEVELMIKELLYLSGNITDTKWFLNGEEACENLNYTESQCSTVGNGSCCYWDDDAGLCLSSIGQQVCLGTGTSDSNVTSTFANETMNTNSTIFAQEMEKMIEVWTKELIYIFELYIKEPEGLLGDGTSIESALLGSLELPPFPDNVATNETALATWLKESVSVLMQESTNHRVEGSASTGLLQPPMLFNDTILSDLIDNGVEYFMKELLQDGNMTFTVTFGDLNGEEACENLNYTESQCSIVGNGSCCYWDDDTDLCLSSIGQQVCLGTGTSFAPTSSKLIDYSPSSAPSEQSSSLTGKPTNSDLSSNPSGLQSLEPSVSTTGTSTSLSSTSPSASQSSSTPSSASLSSPQPSTSSSLGSSTPSGASSIESSSQPSSSNSNQTNTNDGGIKNISTGDPPSMGSKMQISQTMGFVIIMITNILL